MTTRSINHSPDYKSEKERVHEHRKRAGAAVLRIMDAQQERARLEREVIEKAKEWRELRLMQAGTRRALSALMDALDDLAYLESQQQIKK